MVLNPKHGFISDRPLARDDVQLLVDICVQKLSEELSPSLATIQMQVYFDTNFAPREDIINENHANIKLRTTPLMKEIIEGNGDLDKLYRKMVVATVVCSGLGNPTHNGVLREATGKSHWYQNQKLGEQIEIKRCSKAIVITDKYRDKRFRHCNPLVDTILH